MNTALADESKQKARDYLATRGTQVTAAVVHERVAAAIAALDGFLAGVSPAQLLMSLFWIRPKLL